MNGRIYYSAALGLMVLIVTAGAWAMDDGEGNSGAQGQAWENLRALAGSWQGTGQGTPGTSAIQRSYSLILQDKFVRADNVSRFEPKEGQAEGETHQDLSIFSFDRARRVVVLREFHGEGYVNRYTLTEIGPEAKTLTFVTEAVENGPPGLRARLVIHLDDPGSIREQFDLAFPGKDFAACVTADLQRE